jgi:hypothetical protein
LLIRGRNACVRRIDIGLHRDIRVVIGGIGSLKYILFILLSVIHSLDRRGTLPDLSTRKPCKLLLSRDLLLSLSRCRLSDCLLLRRCPLLSGLPSNQARISRSPALSSHKGRLVRDVRCGVLS